MQINLADVLSDENGCLQKTIVNSMEKFSIHREFYDVVEKTDISLFVQNIGKRHVLLRMDVEMKISIPCARCLEPVLVDFPIHYEEEFDQNVLDEDGKGDCLKGNILDLDRLISEEILMQWPYQVLCQEDCKGICPECGMNRNKAMCSCDFGPRDPRMAAIQDIFRNFMEES